MTELLSIRHAATDLAGTFCGHTDPAVNEQGRQQIAGLLQELASTPLDAIVSSDLQRATYTAARIGDAFCLPVHTEQHLREIDFGAWEGLTWNAVEQRDPAFARRWADDFPHVTPPKGEPYQRFRSRVLAAVLRMTARYAFCRRVAVVTHAGVMRLLLQECMGRTAAQAWAATQQHCVRFSYVPRHAEEDRSA